MQSESRKLLLAKAVLHIVTCFMSLVLLCVAVANKVKDGRAVRGNCPFEPYNGEDSSDPQCLVGITADSDISILDFAQKYRGMPVASSKGAFYLNFAADTVGSFDVNGALGASCIAIILDCLVSIGFDFMESGSKTRMMKGLQFFMSMNKILMNPARSLIFGFSRLDLVVLGSNPETFSFLYISDSVVIFGLSMAIFLALSLILTVLVCTRKNSDPEGAKGLMWFLSSILIVATVVIDAYVIIYYFVQSKFYPSIVVESLFRPRNLLHGSSFSRMLGIYLAWMITGVSMVRRWASRSSGGAAKSSSSSSSKTWTRSKQEPLI